MDVGDPRGLVLAFLRGWTTGDYELLDGVLAPDVEYRERGVTLDAASLYESVSAFARAFSSARINVGLWLQQGDLIGCEYTLGAQHLGRFKLERSLVDVVGDDTLEATGREIRVTGVLLCETRDGRITRIVAQQDRLSLLAQVDAFGSLPDDETLHLPELEARRP